MKEGSSQAKVAAHLDVARQRVQQLIDEGVLPSLPGGKLDLDRCRVAYIRHLRDEKRRPAKTLAATRVQDARSREIEIRTAERERRLIDINEAVATLDEIVGPLKAEMAGVGPRVTRDLDLRARLEAEHDAIFSRTVVRLAERASALRAGGGASPPDPSDNT